MAQRKNSVATEVLHVFADSCNERITSATAGYIPTSCQYTQMFALLLAAGVYIVLHTPIVQVTMVQSPVSRLTEENNLTAQI